MTKMGVTNASGPMASLLYQVTKKSKYLINYWFVEYGTSEGSEWYQIDPTYVDDQRNHLNSFRTSFESFGSPILKPR